MSRFAAFMGTKSFHPGGYENQKKVWMAEQAALDVERREEMARAELQRERASEALEFVRDGNAGASAEDVARRRHLELMYRPPPGMRVPGADDKDKDKDKDKGKGKGKDDVDDRFKGAPKEGYLNGQPVRLQPFAQHVRTIRCIKCKQWGHALGDRACPMRDVVRAADENAQREDPLALMRQMEAGGLRLKSFERAVDSSAANQQLVLEDGRTRAAGRDAGAGGEGDDDDDDVRWVEGLSRKAKKRLLRELEAHEQQAKRARGEDDRAGDGDGDGAAADDDKKKKKKAKKDKEKAKKRKGDKHKKERRRRGKKGRHGSGSCGGSNSSSSSSSSPSP